jgi:hypothetical protein
MMEKEFQHKRTAEKNLDRPALQGLLKTAWQEHSTGEEFIKALAKDGYTVSRGDRRPFMIVDRTGRSFDLVREMKGVKTKEVRELLKSHELPKEEKIRQAIRKKQHDKEKHETERERQLREFRERAEKQRDRPHERGV